MNKPKLQPECVTTPEKSGLAAGEDVEILEVRNISLKEALQMVRALADRAYEEIHPQP